MDPNEALARARRLVTEHRLAEPLDCDPDVDALLELLEAFEALDEWITSNGFLPSAWPVRAQGAVLVGVEGGIADYTVSGGIPTALVDWDEVEATIGQEDRSYVEQAIEEVEALPDDDGPLTKTKRLVLINLRQELAKVPVRWDVEYLIRSTITDKVVATGKTTVTAGDETTATSWAVQWVHDNDVHCDARINPIVEVVDLAPAPEEEA
jgi:hypothetical protein